MIKFGDNIIVSKSSSNRHFFFILKGCKTRVSVDTSISLTNNQTDDASSLQRSVDMRQKCTDWQGKCTIAQLVILQRVARLSTCRQGEIASKSSFIASRQSRHFILFPIVLIL